MRTDFNFGIAILLLLIATFVMTLVIYFKIT